MNEELETTTPEMETRTECMKDYEDQFDMSDPWHIVQRYLDEKDEPHPEGGRCCQRWSHRQGRGPSRIHSSLPPVSFLY